MFASGVTMVTGDVLSPPNKEREERKEYEAIADNSVNSCCTAACVDYAGGTGWWGAAQDYDHWAAACGGGRPIFGTDQQRR